MTFNQATEYESGKAFATGYARAYGIADAMTIVRRAALPPSKAPAAAVAEDVASLRYARVAGMVDALLERVQA